MKTKEQILEGYFGSDYFLLKDRDDLQYILRAMEEYAEQAVITPLPTDIEMDEQILKIMDENLSTGTVAENTEGIICNRFATSLKIVHYIKKLLCNAQKLNLPVGSKWPFDMCMLCANNKSGEEAGLFCINNCINGSKFQAASDIEKLTIGS